MNATSDAHGFLLAYPSADTGGWNAGTCCNTADDVTFVSDLVGHLKATYCVDPARTYAVGYSEGGFMAQRLACEMADTFAAIASVAGAPLVPFEQCHPKRPIPVLEIHGTLDGIVPFGGFPSAYPGVYDHSLDRPGFVDQWRRKNNCSDALTPLFHQDDFQGFIDVAVDCISWNDCHETPTAQSPRTDTEVRLCTVTNGAHTWPSSPNPGLTSLTGLTTRALNADEYITSFFQAHPRR
jgi:polyhydroxybutyrate depolymerase